jgi:Nodulation protein Z (NodZ)
MALYKSDVTTSRADLVAQRLRREYRRLSESARLTRAAITLAARAVRQSLPSGLASRKELLVLRSAIYQPGLFSAFATVLGLLEHYDNHLGRYAGVRVDFGDEGLYYEPSAGNNWWEYFFERIDSGTGRNSPAAVLGTDEHFYFARRVERTMPRARGFALIRRYIRPRQHIRDKVDAYVRNKFDAAYTVGVHYRGTDKFKDAPRVSYERVHAAVLDAAKSAEPVQIKIFVATDEQAFLDYMRKLFPDRLHCLDMHRSIDGSPIDMLQGDNRRKGEDAVMDCLLLSRCRYLVRTASNLGLCATLFNPDIPVRLLNRER